jgi:hypothetical protein
MFDAIEALDVSDAFVASSTSSSLSSASAMLI